MTDLKSSIAKGLIAALFSVLAMYAGAASARHEAQTHAGSQSDFS